MKFTLKRIIISISILALLLTLLVNIDVIIPRIIRDRYVSSNMEIPEKEEMEKVVENYLFEKFYESYSSQGGEFFCAVNINWYIDFPNNERIVNAKNSCAGVVLKNNDLFGASEIRDPTLFKLSKLEDGWIVLDQDNRFISPKEPITQDWLKVAIENMPKNLTQCFTDDCYSTEGVTQKAADYYGISLPINSYGRCSTSFDCSEGSICSLSGISNKGLNTCVKKCQTNSDCGAAYTCRPQCVNGENGCPTTSEKICIPDLYSPDYEKDPDSFIGFDDIGYQNRLYINENYPNLVEGCNEELHKSSIVGCNLEVIEDNRIYYYTYVTRDENSNITKAACFRVRPLTDTKLIGVFEGSTLKISPKTCKAVN